MKENLYSVIFYKKSQSQDWSLEIIENLTRAQYLKVITERICYAYPKLVFDKIYDRFVQYESIAPSLGKELLRFSVYSEKSLKEVNPYFLQLEVSQSATEYEKKRVNKWFYKKYPYYSGEGAVPGTGKKKNLKYYRAIDRNVSTGRLMKSLFVENEFKNLIRKKDNIPHFDPWDYDLRSTTNKKSWKLKKTRKKQWQAS